jgi:hypothetical protein
LESVARDRAPRCDRNMTTMLIREADGRGRAAGRKQSHADAGHADARPWVAPACPGGRNWIQVRGADLSLDRRSTSACPGKMDAGSPTRTCANSRNREPFPVHLNREWLYVLMMSYISPLATACCTVATPSLRLAFSV